MKLLKSIFQFLWSIYFIFGFMLMMMIALIVFKIQHFLFKDKYETQFKDFLFRGIGKLMQFVFFIKTENNYHYEYDKTKSYIIVGNHNAAVDIPLNTSTCPKNINLKFLSKAEAAKIPMVGPLIKALSVLVERKNSTSRKRTFELMAKELTKGYSIFLYVEGTRNRTKEPLKKFYDGAFRLAIEHQLPIVVCTLVGTKKINSPHKLLSFLPGKIVSHWEIPIETKGMKKEDIPALKGKIKKIMIERLGFNSQVR